MKILQSGVFRRRVKKLHVAEKQQLDVAIQALVADPTLGQLKTGDLADVRVYKYKHKAQQHLLAYRFDQAGQVLLLLALGSHENFYRDLKR